MEKRWLSVIRDTQTSNWHSPAPSTSGPNVPASDVVGVKMLTYTMWDGSELRYIRSEEV
jgi:hypothetical protein